MTTDHTSPDPDEILQLEDTEPAAVKTTVEGPVRTQSLPRVSSGIRGVTVPDGPPKRLLTADPHRASATIIPIGQPLLIAGSAQEVSGGQPGQIPAGIAVTFTAADELWGACATALTSMTVTVIQERWANG